MIENRLNQTEKDDTEPLSIEGSGTLLNQLNLDSRLTKILEHHDISSATEVQKQVIPYAISGSDLLVCSKTGSGKTFAFLLPMLHRLLHQRALVRGHPRVVILAPTRELAKQVYQQLRLLTTGMNYTSTLILGGENFNDQYKALRNGTTIIVATPGRLADHIAQNNISLHGVEQLIIDEGDRILDLGFSDSLSQIDQAANHRKRQTLFFSATLDHAQVEIVASKMLTKPRHILIDRAQINHGDIEQKFIFSDNLTHKESQLGYLLNDLSFKQLILFCATRSDSERLTNCINEQLLRIDHTRALKAIALHGEMNQQQRSTVMQQVRAMQHNILVTTDVASRGLDLQSISHVINFDLPKRPQEYVHRIGRTGRAGEEGSAYSFVGPKDWDSFLELKAFLEYPLLFYPLPNLAAKFKGFSPKKIAQTELKNAQKTPDIERKSIKKVAKKLDKSYYERQDVGNEIFRVNKKRSVVIDDDEENNDLE